MKANELATILATHGEREVLVWAPDGEGEVSLCPIADVEYDCFHPDGPTVVCIDIDFSNTTTDAVADWLDAEGELPVPKNRWRHSHGAPEVA